MVLRTRRLIAHLRRLAPVVILTFSGCTCGGSSPPPAQPPAAAAATATAPRDTPTAHLAAATAVPPAAAPAAAAPEAPAAGGAPGDAKRAACERVVAVIAGRADDSAVLQSPDARRIADQVPDLVVCGAVRRDSDAPCSRLTDNSQAIGCRSSRSTFSELKTYPKGRGFMFDETKYTECKSDPEVRMPCDAFRAAMRAADPAQCESLGPIAYLCRAYIALDTSQCSPAAGQAPDADCVKIIERNAHLGKGLEALVTSGSPLEQEFAKSALQRDDACAALAQAAMDDCTGGLQPPTTVRPEDRGTPDMPPLKILTPVSGTPASV
jgi:hypothetical protein